MRWGQSLDMEVTVKGQKQNRVLGKLSSGVEKGGEAHLPDVPQDTTSWSRGRGGSLHRRPC